MALPRLPQVVKVEFPKRFDSTEAILYFMSLQLQEINDNLLRLVQK